MKLKENVDLLNKKKLNLIIKIKLWVKIYLI